MIRWIRIRCGASIFNPYNTPSISLKNTRESMQSQLVAVHVAIYYGIFTDRHNNDPGSVYLLRSLQRIVRCWLLTDDAKKSMPLRNTPQPRRESWRRKPKNSRAFPHRMAFLASQSGNMGRKSAARYWATIGLALRPLTPSRTRRRLPRRIRPKRRRQFLSQRPML